MTSQAVSCAFGLLLVTSLLCLVSSSPQFVNVNNCNISDDKILDLCQRCAKHSRASNVYPLCCEDKEEVRTWCDKYLDFGQKH